MRINGTRIIRGQVIRLLVFLPFYLFTFSSVLYGAAFYKSDGR